MSGPQRIYDDALLAKLAKLLQVRGDPELPMDYADKILLTADISDLFQNSSPRRIQLLTDAGPGAALIWTSRATSWVYPTLNRIGAMIVGSSIVAGSFPLTRIDLLSLRFMADQPTAAGTTIDIWQSDDGPGGGLAFSNPATGAVHPSAGSLTLISGADPDVAGTFGTNALKIVGSIPLGVLPANTPFVLPTSGDFIASILPLVPANFNRRLLVNLRVTAAAGPFAVDANIRWWASVRITP